MALNETSAHTQIVLILCDGFQLRGQNKIMTDYSKPYLCKKPINHIKLIEFYISPMMLRLQKKVYKHTKLIAYITYNIGINFDSCILRNTLIVHARAVMAKGRVLELCINLNNLTCFK